MSETVPRPTTGSVRHSALALGALALVALVMTDAGALHAEPAPRPRITSEASIAQQALDREFDALVRADPKSERSGRPTCSSRGRQSGLGRGSGVFGALWPSLTVRFTFDADLGATRRAKALNAMESLALYTPLQFVLDGSGTEPYLVFMDSDGNASPVGPEPGGNTIEILDWNDRGIIQHEIMHSLGFEHEHSRPDRDNYVTFVEENTDPDEVDQFAINPLALTIRDYDFRSLMHYSGCDLSACETIDDCDSEDCATLLAVDADNQKYLGNIQSPSLGDLYSLQMLYGSYGAPSHQDPAQALPLVCADPVQGSLAGARMFLVPSPFAVNLPGWDPCAVQDDQGNCLLPGTTYFPTAVWYSFTGTGSQMELDLTASADVIALVLTESSGRYTKRGIAQPYGNSFSWSTTSGQNYLVAVVGKELLSEATFSLALSCAGPNDDFPYATPILANGSQVPVDLRAATPDGSSTCGNSLPSGDLWYRFTAPEAGTLTVATIGDVDDQGDPITPEAVLSVHEWTTGFPGSSFDQLDCSDTRGSIGGEQSDAEVSVALAKNQVVRLRVSHVDGLLRNGLLELRVRFASANDRCNSPKTVVDGSTMEADFAGARVPDSLWPCIPAEKDVFYRFVAPADGELHLDTYGSGALAPDATVIGLYASCSSQSLIACSGPGTPEVAVTHTMSQGEVVIIALASTSTLPAGQGPKARLNVGFEPFTQFARETFPDLPLVRPEAAWGDVDGDDDLDLVIAGYDLAEDAPITRLIRNDGGGNYSLMAAGLPDLEDAALAWGDADGDGDVDLLFAGRNGTATCGVFRNDGGSFVDSGAVLAGVSSGAVAWADLDQDGDLDAIVTGTATSTPHTCFYRNDGNFSFTAVAAPAGVQDLRGNAVAVGDLGPTPEVDVVIAGRDGSGTPRARLLLNSGDWSFSEITLSGLADGGLSIGDYTPGSNPQMDIAMSGIDSGGTPRVRLYRQDIPFPDWFYSNLPGGGFAESDLEWIDVTLDGALDLVVSGTRSAGGSQYETVIYTFDDAAFAWVEHPAGPTLPAGPLIRAADVDGDTRPDILVGGGPYASGPIPLGIPSTTLFRFSNSLVTNPAPLAPHLDPAASDAHSVDLSWSPAIQSPAPDAAPTWNLRIGTSPGAGDVVPSHSGASGFRRLVAMGNNGRRTALSLSLPQGTYYWSVQAVDSSLRGGPFSAEKTFTLYPMTEVYGPQGPADTYSTSAAWVDVDGDDDLDLYVSEKGVPSLLHRNDGGAVFTTQSISPLTDAGTTHRSVWGDYDNDGDLDVYRCNDDFPSRANQLLRNDGNGVFTDVTAGPLGGSEYSREAEWLDIDGDGDLDLYVLNNWTPNRLLRNDGAAGFVDITAAPLNAADSGVGMTWGDYDDDGDLDCFQAAENDPNRLYRNDGGGMFTDVTPEVVANAGGRAWGGEWVDVDNDGDLDLCVADQFGGNRLLRNDAGNFTDVTGPAILGGRAMAWGDFDNDGDLDVHVAGNGISKLVRNDGTAGFVDATPGVMIDTNNTNSSVWGDYDGDGDLDLYAVRGANLNRFFRNDLDAGRHWLHVELEGVVSNHDGIGARVTVEAGGIQQIREVRGNAGSPIVEFGLGTATNIDRLTVRWPTGYTQLVLPVPSVDTKVVIVEGGTTSVPPALPTEFALHAPVPNPFNPSTTIRFDLPQAGTVELSIYDVAGRRVRSVVRQSMPAGSHEVLWRGVDDGGRHVASGVYLYKLRVGRTWKRGG